MFAHDTKIDSPSASAELPREGGFTLVEVLVAMVIMLVGLLGLFQSVNVGIDHNLRNTFRDLAVRIGEEKMHEARGIAYANLSGNRTFSLTRSFRGASKTYTVQRGITDIPSTPPVNSKKIDITVGWTHKGQNYTHDVSSVIGNPQ